MPAYILANVETTDPVGMDEYRAGVPATLQQYGGRFLVRGPTPQVLEGEFDAPRFVVLEFESAERARQWYNSPEYAPLKALRQRCGHTRMVLLEGLPG